MTKAERIFKDSYREARRHVEAWGYEENSGFNRLTYSEEESVCARTLNEIEKFVESEKRSIKGAYMCKAISLEDATVKAQALKMVANTVQKTRERI